MIDWAVKRDNCPLKKKTGVLIVNLGTPDQPTIRAIRRYLREFLWDNRVVQIPKVIWWFILNFIILVIRPGKSVRGYQEIWTPEGSPLMVHSIALTQHVRECIEVKQGHDVQIELAMRYGNPSIIEGLSAFQDGKVEQLLIVPLYPQYSSTSSGTVFEKVFDTIKNWTYIPGLRVISDYYDHPHYITAIVDSISDYWETNGRSQLLLMSFHGLPEKSREQGDPYHDQCQKTAKRVANDLGLDQTEWRIVFQSRFGYQEWLKPYCVDELNILPDRGIKSVDIICPGFAVDCLETLEEIALTNRQIFLQAGGKQYRYIPALNASEGHVEMLTDLITSEDRFIPADRMRENVKISSSRSRGGNGQ